MTREEAIERIKYCIGKQAWALDENDTEALYEVIPELRESEDERIRKEIISALKFANDGGVYDKHIAYLEEQKPMAWSKKQDDIIGYIRHILNDHAFEHDGLDVNGDYCTDEYVQADDFLKSLRPQPKVEWSEVDEKCLQEMIRHIEHCVKVYGAGQPEWQQWLNLLNSLKNRGNSPKSNANSPSWKPNKEQMEALMLAIEGKCPPTSYMSRRLEDLYEGLANTYSVECELLEE